MIARKVGPRGLKRARTRLLDFLAEALGEDSSQAIVVFDAAGAPAKGADRSMKHKGIAVEFAVGQPTADDFIEAAILAQKRPKQLLVVSNDSRLQDAAKRRGVRSMNCMEFLDHLDRHHLEQRRCPNLARPTKAPPAEAPPARAKGEGTSPAETQRWLREFAGLEDEPELKEALKPFDFEMD